MTRLAVHHKVYFIQEAIFDTDDRYFFEAYKDDTSEVYILTPHFPVGLPETEIIKLQKLLLRSIFKFYHIDEYIIWHYSPMSYAFTLDLQPKYRVYDCMDELSNFLFAPPALKINEAALLCNADIVFTGGHSLYQAKKGLHQNIHCFPSSIDKKHFAKAKEIRSSDENDPADQQGIPWPRIGFFGVIDERLNIPMLQKLAELQPSWQYILIGPIVKIDPAALPDQKNIHYLGPKSYTDLPLYLAGWDIAMMPFALNASTEFISPTKTPEYLAGGVPVIAPSIKDVVTPYFDLGLVSIADTPWEFTQAAETILEHGMSKEWEDKVDTFLAGMSWDQTVSDIKTLIDNGISERLISPTKNIGSYV